MKSYRPVMHFVAGLILTSVALVAAAFAAMKDAWTVAEWKSPLLSFTAWMACTIFAATISAGILQWRRTVRYAVPDPGTTKLDWCVALAPSVFGLLAAWQLVRLAWIEMGAPLLFPGWF